MTKGKGLLSANMLATAALVALAACGGGGGGDTPTGPGTGTGSPGPSGATITIQNGQVSPKTVTISVGQSVTFVNSDGRAHNVSSNPHPAHSDCPSINAVNNIGNGQTKLTNSLPTARSCGFHDHDQPEDVLLQGTIIVQ